MRYKIIFSYEGTEYKGYASQPGEVTIQSELERILSMICNSQIKIYSSGRTDKGVHALNQVAHFDTNKNFEDLIKLRHALNKLLNDDIYIRDIELVNEDFHARFSAKAKEYMYIINLGEFNPFRRNNELTISGLDYSKIIEASKCFEGTHNFMNFTSKDEDEDNFVRTINYVKVEVLNNHLILRFNGNGFMRYQVRKMVGTLIEIGRNKLDKNFILSNLEAKNREIVSYQSPSKGLYLEKVIY